MPKRITYDFGFIRKDTTDNTFEFVACDTIDEMFTLISKHYCFSDCDDTYEVCEIFAYGKRVEYTGWMPGMNFEYRFVETGEVVWKGCFPHWDH